MSFANTIIYLKKITMVLIYNGFIPHWATVGRAILTHVVLRASRRYLQACPAEQTTVAQYEVGDVGKWL